MSLFVCCLILFAVWMMAVCIKFVTIRIQMIFFFWSYEHAIFRLYNNETCFSGFPLLAVYNIRYSENRIAHQ